MKSREVLLAELLNGAPVVFMALSKFWARGLARHGHWVRPHQGWAQKDSECPKSVASLEHHSMTEIASAARKCANRLLVHIQDGNRRRRTFALRLAP